MNLKVEHGIIALLLIAFLYYFFTHQSLLSDLSRVPDNGNPQLKAVKGKHNFVGDFVSDSANFVSDSANFAIALNTATSPAYINRTVDHYRGFD